MENRLEGGTRALGEALARGDARAAAALYADDGKLLSPAAELFAGRRDIERYWRAGLALGLSRLEVAGVEVEASDGLAVETGRYVFLGGGLVLDRGKYLVLHRRQADGGWRRAVDVFNPDAPMKAHLRLEEER
jgi:ketosteroid isomerase-like protein